MTTVTLRREDWERIQKAFVEFQGWFSHLPEEKTLFTGGRDEIQDELVRLLHLQIIALSIKPVEEGDAVPEKDIKNKIANVFHYYRNCKVGEEKIEEMVETVFELMKNFKEISPVKSEEKVCEHDMGDWWREFPVQYHDVPLKKDYPICIYCPKPEERKSLDKVTCFYSSEDKGMIAKWRSLSGFGENTGTAYYELCVALAGVIEILEAERNRGGGK